MTNITAGNSVEGTPPLATSRRAKNDCTIVDPGGGEGLSRVSLTARIVAMKPAPIKPTISTEVLDQIDIRVGTIKSVESVAGADKLVELRVSFGDHTRTILAGLRQERADPQEVAGKQALFVVNLEPRRIRGIVSEGMLFDIGYEDGVRPVLAIPETPVPDGARAG
jgi:tRNA-binding protein